MNFFTKEKMTFWAIAVLIILNVVTLSVFWIRGWRSHPYERGFHEHQPAPLPSHFQQPLQAPPHGQKDSPPPPLLVHELGLNEEQAKALEKLKDDHFEKVEAVHEEVGKIKKELFDLLFKEEAADASVAEKIEMLGQKRSEVERETFRHFKDILKLCNDDQKKRFKDIMEKALPHKPHHHGPPPGGLPPAGPPAGPPPAANPPLPGGPPSKAGPPPAGMPGGPPPHVHHAPPAPPGPTVR